MVGNDTQRRVRRLGQPVHLPTKQDLVLDLLVLDGGVVKVLEDDAASGDFALWLLVLSWWFWVGGGGLGES